MKFHRNFSKRTTLFQQNFSEINLCFVYSFRHFILVKFHFGKTFHSGGILASNKAGLVETSDQLGHKPDALVLQFAIHMDPAILNRIQVRAVARPVNDLEWLV